MSRIRTVKSNHTSREIEDSLGLMKESFGNVDVSYRQYYEWQYLQNPVGKGTVLIAYDDDRAIGQFASIPSTYMINGKAVSCSLTLNLAVSPRYRGKGTMHRLLDDIRKVEPHVPFSIGVPNKNSLSGHLKNGFKPLQTNVLVRPIRPSKYFDDAKRRFLKPFDKIWKKETIDQVRELNLLFDERFEEFAGTLYKDRVHQVRSAAFLNWRYRLNPRRKYTTFMVTDSSEHLEGYAILSTAELMNKNIGVIMDFVVRDRNIADSLILRTLQYFWEKEVALVLYSCFPNDHTSSFLRAHMFLKLPKRFSPHPLILCLKILDTTNEYATNLLDLQKWIFRFGDYDIF